MGKVESGEIDDVRVEGEWEVVPIKLDSGAFDWVFSPATASAFATEETADSKKRLSYVAAKGRPIKNYGQRRIKGFTGDWATVEAAVQFAEVKRNLASAMKIIKAGNRIVLDEAGSYIEDKQTGRK